jgi:hypothetical protein
LEWRTATQCAGTDRRACEATFTAFGRGLGGDLGEHLTRRLQARHHRYVTIGEVGELLGRRLLSADPRVGVQAVVATTQRVSRVPAIGQCSP